MDALTLRFFGTRGRRCLLNSRSDAIHGLLVLVEGMRLPEGKPPHHLQADTQFVGPQESPIHSLAPQNLHYPQRARRDGAQAQAGLAEKGAPRPSASFSKFRIHLPSPEQRCRERSFAGSNGPGLFPLLVSASRGDLFSVGPPLSAMRAPGRRIPGSDDCISPGPCHHPSNDASIRPADTVVPWPENPRQRPGQPFAGTPLLVHHPSGTRTNPA